VWTSASSARDLANLADSVQGLNSRLLIAVGSSEAFSAAQAKGYEISAKTGAGYDAAATLLARLSQVGRGYGLTQEQIATTTQVTARSLQLSGAAAAESTAVVRQLSQALGSGVLRGEEFNSVMENGPRLAKALADGLGLPIGKLRGLAEQGLLTTDIVVAALESQAGVLEAEAENYQRTMGQAGTRVTDEFGRMVDAANQWTGAGQGVVSTFDYVADNMEELLGGVAVAAVAGLNVAMVRGGQAAAAWAAQTVVEQARVTTSTIRLHQAVVAEAQAEVIAAEQRLAAVPAMFRSVAAEQALTAAKQRLTTAQVALNAAQAESTIIARGLSAVVGGLGGPIGIITTLLTAGATAWMIWGDKAENAANKAKNAAEEAEQAIRRMRNAQAFGEDALAPFRQDIAQAEAMLAEARKVRSGYNVNPSGDVEFFTYVDDGAIAAAEAKVSAAYARLHEAARIQRKKVESEQTGALSSSLNIMGKSFDTWLDKFRDRIDPVGAALKDLAAKAKEAGIAVDSQQYKDAEALIRKSFAKKSTTAGKSLDLDEYGSSALAAMQAQSQRGLDVLKAKLASELSIAQRGYDAGTTDLQAYYAERRRIIETESAAEIAAQERVVAKAQAEQERLRQLNPGGARGQEQISDQLRALDEKIADAQTRIEVLKTQTATTVADLGAEQAKAARERIDKAMNDAQAIISATEQSLQSRVITGVETESTARAKLKDAIGEQAQALQSKLVPQIERLMLAASNPLARAELQAVLDKIREMQATAKEQTWIDGLKQGVADYGATAKDAFQTARDGATMAFQAAEDAVVQFAKTGKVEFSDLVTSINAEIARLAFRKMAAEMYEYMSALMSSVSGSTSTSSSGSSLWGSLLQVGISAVSSYFGGGSMASAAAGSASSGFNYAGEMSSFFSMNAKGNAYQSPSLSAYSNGIYNSPRLFAFAQGAGVFAEEGWEGIFPLRRMASGNLGVEAVGGGSDPETKSLLRELIAATRAQKAQKNVFAFDRRTVANELSGAEGEQMTLSHVRRNASAIGRILGIR
jgi:lambda family phage tail tape measure protein